MRYLIVWLLIFYSVAGAVVLISPFEAMRQTFANECTLTKKNILLNKKQAAKVSGKAKLRLNTKIFRIYTASIDGEPIGYGVLITRKVRQKDAAVLYMMDLKGVLKGIEIIAFGEPPEYIPKNGYLKQFEGKSDGDTLRVGKDIPSISGATLSARNITDGARLALAVFDVLIGKRL